MKPLPPTLEAMARLMELLAPSLAYRDENATHRHRARKAAEVLHYRQPCNYSERLQGWRVTSYTRPGLTHFVDLDALTCDCEDYERAKADRDPICIHILAAAMADVQRAMLLDAVAAAQAGAGDEQNFEKLIDMLFGVAA